MAPGWSIFSRMTLLDEICAFAAGLHAEPAVRIGVDGVDGVGKTTFADQLGQALERQGRMVIRSSVDGFHNPASIRHRLGRGSPEGFYRDSYDYLALRENLLDPLSQGGSRRYREAVFDHLTDSPAPAPWRTAPQNAILVFDGLFLHRPELRGYWDFSIFLDAPFAVTVPRGASRGEGFGDPDPQAPSNRRYVDGNRIYFDEAQPQERATVVLNYTDIETASVVTWRR